jgi:bacillithiol synthase
MTGPGTGLELHVGPPSGRLISDYLNGEEALRGFFAGHPLDPDAYRRKAAAVRRRMDMAVRARVRSAYRPTNASAAGKLERVLSGDGFAVTTGQQPGLFGGPLYTLYKILSAVRLAETLEPIVEQPVLAVFWIGAHDHDWAEVNHAHVVDSANQLRRIEIAGDAEPPFAMYDRVLGQPATAVTDEFVRMLPDSEFARPLIDALGSAYRPDRTMSAAFGDLLYALLRDMDVAIFDPSHPDVFRAAGPVLANDLAHAEEHERLVRAQSERLASAGYPVQVAVADDGSNVFLHDENGRDRLMRENGGWTLRRTKRTLSDVELTGLVASHPEMFSPNVLLRPVVESSLIPTLAYVGGPAETSYLAQIGCLFEAHGIEPPLVMPRRNVTIVEGKIRKVLDKFSLSPSDFAKPFHELATEVIRGELPDAVVGPTDRLRATIEREYEVLIEGAAAIDPTLRGWITGNRNAILSQLEAAQKKVTSHLKKRSDVELDQLGKAAVSLYPDGSPQERTLNVLPLLARYGPGLLLDLAGVMSYEIDVTADGWNGVDCG